MSALVATILGAVTGVIPRIVDFFEKRDDNKQTIELRKLELEAADKGYEWQLKLEDAKADREEGESLRRHDAALGGGKFINSLRASVRPVITYLFFFTFVTIKVSALITLLAAGIDIPTALGVIWDADTAAIFGAIMGFWFGGRLIEKLKRQ